MNRMFRLLLLTVALALISTAAQAQTATPTVTVTATPTLTPTRTATPTLTPTPTVTQTPVPAATASPGLIPGALTGALRGRCIVDPPSLAAGLSTTTICFVNKVRLGMGCFILHPTLEPAGGGPPTMAVTRCELIDSQHIRFTLTNINNTTRNETPQTIFWLLTPIDLTPPRQGGKPG